MNILSLFSKNQDKQPVKAETASHWIKCKSCNSLMYYKEVENQNYVCPKCGFHFRIG
ncbi:MAG: acetyl-CoA carboxylase carboxyl transferase subunit beta, partial [Campylobacterota bacterium]|nr:acetyl-CoA carboxylase carboxyl transferase subunit beta [Campylobacterota bacterium]